MLDFSDFDPCELLALGRRASELSARRFDELIRAVDPADHALQGVLRKMAVESMSHAALVEQYENQLPEESRLASHPDDALRLIRSNLTSLSKSLGEGPVHRDAALFFAESLEEEASRLYRVLAGHSRESRNVKLFSDMAEREQCNFRYLREAILDG